jgi:hypothetical protein
MKPFWIVFKHNDGRFEIWKEYDNTHVWDAPTYEVVGYFDNRNDAVACVKKCKTNNLNVKRGGNESFNRLRVLRDCEGRFHCEGS